MDFTTNSPTGTTTTTTTTTKSVAGVWKRLWEEDPLGDTVNADYDTLVLWTQTPNSGIYIDIRLPLGSPGRSDDAAKSAGYDPKPDALEAVAMTTPSQRSPDPSNTATTTTTIEGSSRIHTEEELLVLLQQKSFAGVLHHALGDTTSGDALRVDEKLAQLATMASSPKMVTAGALPLCTCFWRRDVDYQPPTGGLDIGVCASGPTNVDGSIDLRETGSDGSYAEGWHRLPHSGITGGGPFLALQLISENSVERMGYWVRTGKYFAYCVGRPHDTDSARALGCHEDSAMVQTCVGKSLKEAIVSISTGTATNYNDGNDVNVQLAALGSYVAVAGEIEDGTTENGDLGATTSSPSWKIKHSTDPGLVGCYLVGTSTTPLCCSTLTVKGGTTTSSSSPTGNIESIKVGDTLLQAICGLRHKVREWKVIEIDGNCGLPFIGRDVKDMDVDVEAAVENA